MDFSNDNEKLLFKQRLKQACLDILSQRIGRAESAISNSQEAANGEEKSSVGDKHETGRARAQMDNYLFSKQLSEIKKEYAFIASIDIQLSETISLGSVYQLDNLLFFVASGIGTVVLDGVEVIVVSAVSPACKTLLGKAEGAVVEFLSRPATIRKVF